jgi:hypothetical protein
MILRMSALDAEESRRLGSLKDIIGLLECQPADLSALGVLIDTDRARIRRGEDGSGAALERRRLHSRERLYIELAGVLEGDQADALKMAAELQRKSVEFSEWRQALVRRMSAPLRARYEAAVREGRRPAVVAARGDACPACGAALVAEARRRMGEGGQIVPCSRCQRLLRHPSLVERDFLPATMPPRPKRDP